MKCAAAHLKQCPSCKNVIKSVCSRSSCRGEDGSKPSMILPNRPTQRAPTKRKLLPVSDEESDMEDDITSSDSDSEVETGIADGNDENKADGENFKVGDYVKVMKNPFKGFYATVLGESYGGR